MHSFTRHFHFRTLIIAVAALPLLCMPPIGYAQAQDGLPDAAGVRAPQAASDPTDILTDEMKMSESAYKKVRDKLKPQQKAILEELENSYLLALAPEMEVARLSWQLRSCRYDNSEQRAEDASVFSAFKIEKKRETDQLKEKTATAYKDKTTFIDPAILTRHVAIFMHFGKHVSLQALRGQMADTPAKELCAQGRAALRAYSGGQ